MNCITCGGPLSGRQRKHCSPVCASRSFNVARQTDGRLREYRRRPEVKTRNRDRLRVAAAERRYMEAFTCARCGGPGERRRGEPGRYCSRACASPSRRKRAMRRLSDAAGGTSGGQRVWVQGPCTRCGTHFLSPGGRYCSKVCRSRDRSDRRRAAGRDAKISRVRRYAIYARDNWTCYLCGYPVDRTAVVPAIEAPVLDHVIPLASGGEHSEANLRTAHWLCNSIKADRPIADVIAAA